MREIPEIPGTRNIIDAVSRWPLGVGRWRWNFVDVLLYSMIRERLAEYVLRLKTCIDGPVSFSSCSFFYFQDPEDSEERSRYMQRYFVTRD